MRERIEELYVAHGPMAYRRCLSVLRDEEAAYDALQEVFVKLMDSPFVLARMRDPAAYLYRAATNAALNQLRRDRRRLRVAIDAVAEPADARSLDAEDALAAAMLLELLADGVGARTREIAYCRYADGLGLQEIAERVGLSFSAVRKHLDAFKAHARRRKEKIA
ncbi:MAG: hypothetical protein A2Z99_19505 [Treponema sp. GWB1_62_6]|nr:MAG: hypothetical protein A2001_11965 [Treponema sp. GWC1_61_84]OHE72234.1 MAG: hypothetical protein A2Z99_19505 [Treponema sp. GWB1_62_6]OHE72412.1 MAG: hypothetical protein A2413_03710 [Treponema sp. RIFOXYC1_FULL_61_9]HCM28593.1 sigma-70 family RNA polymerase sigma factor [Treponema sp.]